MKNKDTGKLTANQRKELQRKQKSKQNIPSKKQLEAASDTLIDEVNLDEQLNPGNAVTKSKRQYNKKLL